jgi:hypothetical protein
MSLPLRRPHFLIHNSSFLRWFSYIMLIAILLTVTVLARITSIKKFGVLYDEQITRAVVVNIWKGDLSNNWKFANVPPVFRRNCYNFSSYFYADALLTGPNPYHGLFKDRIASAVLGALAVITFAWFALIEFGPAVGLASLAAMAVVPLLVQDSHYARPEAFSSFLFGLLYILILCSLRTFKPSLFLAAGGLICGLLIACKISFCPASGLLLVAFSNRRLQNICSLLLLAASIVLGFFIGVPDAFIHPAAFMDGVTMLRSAYAHEFPPFSLIDSSNSARLLFPYFWQTLGPFFCVLSAAGLAFLIIERRLRQSILLAGPVIFYLAFFALQRAFFERNLSHVAPLLAILCGFAVVRLAELCGRYWKGAFLLLLASVCIRPAFVSYRFVVYALTKSPEKLAANITRNLQLRYKSTIQPTGDLLVPSNIDQLANLIAHSSNDIIAPTKDYHDPYTVRMLRRAQKQLDVQLVAYSPSLFPKLSTNTIIVYHAFGIRYLLLRAPDSFQLNNMTFVSFRHVVRPLGHFSILANNSWVSPGVDPGVAVLPILKDVYGSYTSTAGDANKGTIVFGPVTVHKGQVVGIPFMTGPSQIGLSLTIVDHVSHRVITQLNPVPNVPLWSVWRLPLSSAKDQTFDVVGLDEGSAWGQWLATSAPVLLDK